MSADGKYRLQAPWFQLWAREWLEPRNVEVLY